jgi:hypothetical protein
MRRTQEVLQAELDFQVARRSKSIIDAGKLGQHLLCLDSGRGGVQCDPLVCNTAH